MKYWGSIFVMFLTTFAYADVVIDAIPRSRVDATPENANREVFSASKRQESRLIITKVDGQYYWATRENTPMTYTTSGIFHLFIDPKGGGYVEVADTHSLPSAFREKGARFQYKEHVRSGMWGAFTYFGETDAFAP